jgi:hypothetical protein
MEVNAWNVRTAEHAALGAEHPSRPKGFGINEMNNASFHPAGNARKRPEIALSLTMSHGVRVDQSYRQSGGSADRLRIRPISEQHDSEDNYSKLKKNGA